MRRFTRMTLRFLGHITYERCNFVYKYNGTDDHLDNTDFNEIFSNGHTDDHLDNTDFNEIFSNGHTARGILVYVLRNLLKRVLGESFKVDIKENSLFLSKGRWNKELYSFHAFNLGLTDEEIIDEELYSFEEIIEEKIRNKILEEYKEYKEYKDKISGYYCAVLDGFLPSQTVEFYELDNV